MQVQLRGKGNEIISSGELTTQPGGWKNYKLEFAVNTNVDSARLFVLVKSKAKIALDEISLFPRNTFRNEPNGLRPDLADAIAALKPKFMRFPGGCLVHGDGLANIYKWKNTIGPVEQRIQQRNIWSYHQSVGLGFYEYFRFCEDIGAKPLPVVAAGVSCQNSGESWQIGSVGQQALPVEEMSGYIQDVLDLIEYANGPVTSTWGAKRAAAGHPKSFHLQYIGIGNEDKQTDDFRSRFKMIYDVVKKQHPEITIVGTVGPSPSGQDYDLGWKLANNLEVPIVDEHFYEKPKWFLDNNPRYDSYDRNKSKVYIGEYASQNNTMLNALSEAAFMTSLERNGDVVQMASYAPLLANINHTSWNPNLIYFNNKTLAPTVNYYVQQLFSANQGDLYYGGVISFPSDIVKKDSVLAASCVKDSKNGYIILKIVNAGPNAVNAKIDLSAFGKLKADAQLQFLTGKPSDKNTLENSTVVLPGLKTIATASLKNFAVPAYSLNVIRLSLIPNKNQ